jgi:CRISPR-associated endonuclease/helicase Cas3
LNIDFNTLFNCAMGTGISPYPYQSGLSNKPWPDIIKIETGMGKTASIILTWLFKRLLNDPETPRRLVYCLPMRVLVEQTYTNAIQWIEKLTDGNILPNSRKPSVNMLMGGEVDQDWDRYPEQDAILIGTQDQLLSRALNRGYAMSRFRWPINFGLLNNDCLWVMDEVQLMGSGLTTSAQLQAFRNSLGTALPVHSVWMSATLQKDWLETIDFMKAAGSLSEMTLLEEDKNNPSVKKRFEAEKELNEVDYSTEKSEKKISELVLDVHRKGTRTLAVFNTVKRAIDIYKAIKSKKPEINVVLVHSRFRSGDRLAALEKVLRQPDEAGTICISTQVVEAGVDVSATTLVTDLAPWASMVQRFGRCNRYGLDASARVFWLRIDPDKKGAALPYEKEELEQSARILSELKDVGPQNLPPVHLRSGYHQVLRRRDIIDLFDTTPDLSGLDIDISRFIRETNDHDVQVFWRDILKEGPRSEEPAPSKKELCSVPIGDLRATEKLDRWRWDHLEKRWSKERNIVPGMVLMLRMSDGCYSSEIGWTGVRTDIPEPVETGNANEEGIDDDQYAILTWQSLVDHNEMVVKELKSILSKIEIKEEAWKETLLLVALWHDAGKVHEVFQKAMVGDPPEADASVAWAKTARGKVSYERKGFRHELASALAMLQNHFPDLAAYLAAAHHGKVRLSIRSLPAEAKPPDPNKRFARGIWERDRLKETDLGAGHVLPETFLDLSYMEFGDGSRGPSWAARMLSLRDDMSLGPFKLAYLESLLRSADWRASTTRHENDV